jgi:hypothetical protein
MDSYTTTLLVGIAYCVLSRNHESFFWVCAIVHKYITTVGALQKGATKATERAIIGFAHRRW